jgi:hypothetical protein
MAILELRAARGRSLPQTARRFLVTPATIASWNQRLDEEGLGALVQIREPVNRFPEFVPYSPQPSAPQIVPESTTISTSWVQF